MLAVYDPGLSGYHEVRFISFQSEEWFNDIGKFTLVVPPTAGNVAHLLKGSILFRTETKQSMVIVRVAPDASQNNMTVNGYTTNWLLNKRSISTQTVIATVEADLYAMIAANLRNLPNVETAVLKTLTETYSAILYGGQMLDEFMPILDAVELGQRMTFDTTAKKHVFEIYKGNDLSTGSHAAVFSDEQGTARDLKIEDDESTFKNYCYVTGTLTDGSGVVREVGSATGGDRYEYWFDSKLKQESGEALADFYTRMDDAGAAELAKRVRNVGFSVTIDSREYGVAYKMGDRVKCVSKRFGISFTAIINGVKRAVEARSETVTVVLGEPQLSIIGEMKLSWQR